MKTLLLILRTKLFLLGLLSTCTFILANNYIHRNDPFRLTEVKEDFVAKPGNSVIAKRKVAKQKMNLQLQGNSFRDADASFTATVTSDKPDYAPLSTAIFTGAGFAPNEDVVLKVKNLFQPCHTVSADSSYFPWTVTADEDGAFVTPWTVCNCPGDSLRLKAIGQTSGSIAYVYFSDAGAFGYATTSGKASTVTLAVGATDNTTLSADVSAPANNGSFNVSLSFATTSGTTIGIGSGANQIDLSSVTKAFVTTPNPGGSGDTETFPVTVSVGSSVAPDTYNFKATGIESAGTVSDGSGWSFSVIVEAVGGSGGLTVTAPACAQGGSFAITYSPPSGPDVTETKTTPFSFTAKKNTNYSITTISSTVNGNTYTGAATVTGTTPNTNDFTQTVTLSYSDNTAPTITCPGNIVLACGASVLADNTGSATTTDNCTDAGSIIITSADDVTIPGACGGTIKRTWTAKDASNNESTCQQTITISPAALPTMTAPGDITVTCGGIPAASTLPFSNGLSGGCLISGTSNNSTFTATPGACGGDVTETWTAADECGRAVTSVSRTIHVSAAALPTMTAPGNITVGCGAIPSASTLPFSNGLSGGCLISGTSNVSTFSATPVACGGDVTETWTATDACGRTVTSVSRTIHVSAAALPTMTAPGDITVACGAIPAASTLPFSNGLSDGCLISGTSNNSTFTATPGACGGDVTETWTATDACGRTVTSVSRTIHVSAAALPTMTAPSNITVACGAIPAASTLPFSNGLSDGCLISGGSNNSTFTATPGACGGDVTETWTATDECGRTVQSVSRTIHVSAAALPTMTAPGDITVACGAIPAASTLPFSNGLSDGCLISGVSNSSTFSATPGACGGDVAETWTATDACGRTVTSVSRTIHVSAAALPTMTAPGDITVACGAIPAASTLPFSNGLSDGCLISGTSNNSTFTATPGACGGDVTETWTATDACGRTVTSISRTIHVSAAALPTMTAPGDITVGCGAIPAASTLPFSNGLSGGCLISGVSNNSTFTATPGACGGDVTETWTATDACGRTVGSVSRTIHVSAAALPTMTAPGDITVACGAIPAASTLPFSNGLSGGCLISGTSNNSTFTATPGACGGDVTETWTATDACGRTVTSVSRTIHVSAAALPTMTAPGEITVACGAIPSASTLPFSNGLSDGCLISGVSSGSTFSSAPTSGCGDVTETWTATDACGRALASVSRIIHVVDNTAPLISCTANKSVNPNNGTPACTYKHAGTAWNANASDICSNATVVYNLSGATTTSDLATLNNAVFSSGITTVTAIATDACGNSAQCSFTVTVTGTLTAACSNTNPTLYFGYSGDQTSTIKVYPSGGTGPYTVAITMNRVLNCNIVNNAGDEVWTGAGGSTINNNCPSSGPGLTPVSTGTAITAGGFYSVNVTLMQDATFTATITDANGCTVTCSTTVHAEDARCFNGNSGVAKVTICHKTGSATNPCVKICVDESAVASHLAHGDFLGNCTPNCLAPVYTTGLGTINNNAMAEVSIDEGFQVKAFPNPTEHHFTVSIKSNSNEKVSVVVYDALGRQVKKIEKEDAMSPVQFGEDLKTGIYIIEVCQGGNRKTIKLLKQ